MYLGSSSSEHTGETDHHKWRLVGIYSGLFVLLSTVCFARFMDYSRDGSFTYGSGKLFFAVAVLMTVASLSISKLPEKFPFENRQIISGFRIVTLVAVVMSPTMYSVARIQKPMETPTPGYIISDPRVWDLVDAAENTPIACLQLPDGGNVIPQTNFEHYHCTRFFANLSGLEQSAASLIQYAVGIRTWGSLVSDVSSNYPELLERDVIVSSNSATSFTMLPLALLFENSPLARTVDVRYLSDGLDSADLLTSVEIVAGQFDGSVDVNSSNRVSGWVGPSVTEIWLIGWEGVSSPYQLEERNDVGSTYGSDYFYSGFGFTGSFSGLTCIGFRTTSSVTFTGDCSSLGL